MTPPPVVMRRPGRLQPSIARFTPLPTDVAFLRPHQRTLPTSFTPITPVSTPLCSSTRPPTASRSNRVRRPPRRHPDRFAVRRHTRVRDAPSRYSLVTRSNWSHLFVPVPERPRHRNEERERDRAFLCRARLGRCRTWSVEHLRVGNGTGRVARYDRRGLNVWYRGSRRRFEGFWEGGGGRTSSSRSEIVVLQYGIELSVEFIGSGRLWWTLKLEKLGHVERE